MGRRRDYGDGGGRAEPAARLSRRSHGGIFLSAEGKYFAPHHGNAGPAAVGNFDQGGRHFSFAEAPAALAAAARGHNRSGGRSAAPGRLSGRIRMVLPGLPPVGLSGGSEAAKHRQRSATGV